MSKITIETTITPRYLRNRTKDQLINLVLSLLDQNDHITRFAAHMARWVSIYDSLEPHERETLVEDADKWLQARNATGASQ